MGTDYERNLTDEVEQALVTELARATAEDTAPEELLLFDTTAEDYWADPQAVLSPTRRGEAVGFGIDAALLTPLLLATEGLRPADIARVVMLYYLAAILVGPLAGEISERSGRDLVPVSIGILIASLALLSLAAWSGEKALTAAVLGVGIGHALMRAPLQDLAIAYAGGSGKAVDLVRLSERLGAMAGLGAAALLVTGAGGWTLPAILGIVTAAGGLLFAASSAMAFYREKYNHEVR